MNDRAALVTCSTRADLVSEFADTIGGVEKSGRDQPSFGAARIDEGLRQVTKVLMTANPKLKTELCVISDLAAERVDNIGKHSPAPQVGGADDRPG